MMDNQYAVAYAYRQTRDCVTVGDLWLCYSLYFYKIFGIDLASTCLVLCSILIRAK